MPALTQESQSHQFQVQWRNGLIWSCYFSIRFDSPASPLKSLDTVWDKWAWFWTNGRVWQTSQEIITIWFHSGIVFFGIFEVSQPFEDVLPTFSSQKRGAEDNHGETVTFQKSNFRLKISALDKTLQLMNVEFWFNFKILACNRSRLCCLFCKIQGCLSPCNYGDFACLAASEAKRLEKTKCV